MKSCFYCKIIFVTILFSFVFLSDSLAQGTEAYPSNWFTQMKLNKIQILSNFIKLLYIFGNLNFLENRLR